MKKMKIWTAYICLGLASFFKSVAKKMMPGIIVAALPLPGWFLVDSCIIKHVELRDSKLKGFEWRSWGMPDEWNDDMNKTTRGKD